ncbi:unnamed protein product [Miscanthus lutarioriparius]|uniref:BTB domain-containing protein n=1 Tax=Miscanthus lutarioriparius TaxID=422564 RepID=A0A811N622_9POAL|nr:unnamed protein product [Miscanthus lutarioriparius]
MRVIAMHGHINEAARPQSAEDDEGAELEHPLGRYAWQEHSLLDLGALEGARRRRSRGRPMQLCWLATTRWHWRPESGAGNELVALRSNGCAVPLASGKACTVFHARESKSFNLRVNNSPTKHLSGDECIDIDVSIPAAAGFTCTAKYWPNWQSSDVEANCVVEDHFTAICMVAVSKVWPPLPLPTLSRLEHDILMTSDLTDVSFQVDGETFRAHRLVLAARSPVFRTELFGRRQMAESCRQIRAGHPQTNFAEERACLKLKSRCLDFLADGEKFKAVAVTNEYIDLMKKVPSLLDHVQNRFKRPRLS